MEPREERDWVAVANDLFSKCHISPQVTRLSDCDANAFVALYEAILGERVPDYIAAPKSQEDDAHNVQAVIDSLALDYLQISLPHITGENIVRGDKESIQNLLEIFDGLLEYLTEQISEASSQPGNGEDDFLSKEGISVIRGALQKELSHQHDERLPELRESSSNETCASLSSNKDRGGSESTGELIRLGESACTFSRRKDIDVPVCTHNGAAETDSELDITWTQRRNDIYALPLGNDTISGTRLEDTQTQERSATFITPRNLSTGPNALQLGEPIRSAIPLQSPYHLTEHRTAAEAPALPEPRQQRESPTSMVSQADQPSSHRGSPRLARRQNVDSSTICNFLERNVSANAILSRLSPDLMQEGSQQDNAGDGIKHQQVTQSPTRNAKRVAFQIEPDIKFVTARSNAEQCDAEEGRSIDRYKASGMPGIERSFQSDAETSLLDHNHHIDAFGNTPLSHRRAKNHLAEQELHEISEKLSCRLHQLDLMLKQALGEKYEASNLKDEDKLSQHSDSITEYRRVQRLPVTPHLKKPSRARSLSPSPPRPSVRTECEGALNGEASGQLRRIDKELQQELDFQKMKVKMVSQLYKEELEDYKTKERSQLSEEKEKAKKTEREYQENIFREALRTPQAARVYCAKGMPRKPKCNQWSPGGLVKPRKGTPMKIKDNDMLPLLLDEFPSLQISPHTMNRMWKQQFRQIEQLTKSTGEQDRTQIKLQLAIEDAQRKHDLLVQIIKKEQEHNQRLRDFKERVQQQKFAQNKVKEQRQQVARAQKYYNDYHVQLRAKMMRVKTREERIFKNLFEEGLELQKHRLHELKTYAKEKRQEQKKRQREELESMENYYKDQFLMLAETLAQERHKVQIRETAQTKALHKMKQDLRVKMEKEIRELQAMITQDDDDAYFRELEAERQQRRVQMASFQFSKPQSF